MIFSQLLANSLIIGSIYALVASGFSLIYGTNKFMHFAHGSTVVVASYLLYLFYNVLNTPFALACIVTLMLSAALGFGMFRLLYYPLQKKNSSNIVLLIASIGLLILLENLILLIAGADVKTIGLIPITKGMNILGAIITPLQVTIILISSILFVALWIFMKKTRIGRDIRAVADNKELAKIVGINDKRIADWSFIIGSFLAGIAGILIALEQNLEPSMGTNLMIKGFTGSVIGGITSVPGSLLGSYILGVAENFGIWYLPSGYKDAIAFVLLFIFLLFRPTGILGVNKGAKE